MQHQERDRHDRGHDDHTEHEDDVRRTLDELGDDDADTLESQFNPHTGEDPGLLELTEDPRERRLKRNTM